LAAVIERYTNFQPVRKGPWPPELAISEADCALQEADVRPRGPAHDAAPHRVDQSPVSVLCVQVAKAQEEVAAVAAE
jgi:hypothetical protein